MNAKAQRGIDEKQLHRVTIRRMLNKAAKVMPDCKNNLKTLQRHMALQ